MKVGDKVWVYLIGSWAKAVVVRKPSSMQAKPKSVFVQLEDDKDIYRYSRGFVKPRKEEE